MAEIKVIVLSHSGQEVLLQWDGSIWDFITVEDYPTNDMVSVKRQLQSKTGLDGHDIQIDSLMWVDITAKYGKQRKLVVWYGVCKKDDVAIKIGSGVELAWAAIDDSTLEGVKDKEFASIFLREALYCFHNE